MEAASKSMEAFPRKTSVVHDACWAEHGKWGRGNKRFFDRVAHCRMSGKQRLFVKYGTEQVGCM